MIPITPPLRQESFSTPINHNKNTLNLHIDKDSRNGANINLKSSLKDVEHENSGASYLNSPISPTSQSFQQKGNRQSSCSKLDVELEKFNNQNLVALKNFTLNPLSYHLKLLNVIGCGSFANVLGCHFVDLHTLSTSNNHSESEQTLAIKIPLSSKKISFILKESLMLCGMNRYYASHLFPHNLNYPFVKSYGMVNLSRSNYSKVRHGEILPGILLEKLSSNLDEFISNTQPIENEVYISGKIWWKLCEDLFNALIIMRNMGIVHSDLKPANILIKYHEFEETSSIDFKISDFTSSISVNEPISDFKQINTTLEFSSPKIITNPPTAPDFQSDLYSVGLILLNAATGKKPYSNVSSITSNNNIYLINLIQSNSILKTLSQEELNLVGLDPNVSKLLNMIIMQNCHLDDVVDFLHEIGVDCGEF